MIIGHIPAGYMTAHALLDSVVGDIAWLAPFDYRFFALFAVPAIYKTWWLNFILHWSFFLEIGMLAAALMLWRRRQPLKISR